MKTHSINIAFDGNDMSSLYGPIKHERWSIANLIFLKQSFSITFSWNSINHELWLWLSLGIVWNIQHRYRSSATLIQLMQMSFATFILLHLSSYCCPPNIPCIFHYNFIKRDFPLNISQLFLVLARSTVWLLPIKGPDILSQGYYMFINRPQEFPNASNLTMLYYFQMLNTSHLG